MTESNYWASLTFTELQQSKQMKQGEIDALRLELDAAQELTRMTANERITTIMRIKHLRDDLEAIEKQIGWYTTK